MMASSLSHRRAIIVGSGQAGLSVAAALIAEGLAPQRDFVVIDAAPGQRAWASRWESMMLLSDARHSALPAHPLPGDQRRHPRADEITDYLARVESSLGVRTRWGVAATGIERRGDGSTLHLITDVGQVQTRNVVCATGAAAQPLLPAWAPDVTVPGVTIHSNSYRRPEDVPAGDVLIVGGGNSGVQLSRELSVTHSVSLAVRTPRRRRNLNTYPHSAGETVDWLRRTRLPEPLFGTGYDNLRQLGVRILAEAVSARGGSVLFADGTAAEPTSVIFATGYTPGDRWIPDAARPERARHCTTRFPGLFVAGLPRYSSRRVDTLAGVWKDAITIAHQIINRP